MSDVVRFYKKGRIGVISLEEKEHKNTFTKSFIHGLQTAFHKIDTDETIHVVLVHGYDNYFCCGGTKSELRELAHGNAKFNEFGFFDVFLRCRLPIVAAMQGHAIGGGLAFGCYADVIVAAEQSIYSANFMNYGFTPGMGATCIIPKKMGEAIGVEMLYSGKNYFGAELKERGAGIKIVPKDAVINVAWDLAEELAKKPRESLMLLKEHLTSPLRLAVEQSIEHELKMHEKTFTHKDVIKRIEELYA